MNEHFVKWHCLIHKIIIIVCKWCIYDIIRIGKGIIISPVEPFEISSTELRSLLKTGESTEKYLDGKVRKYIEDRGLYGYPKK